MGVEIERKFLLKNEDWKNFVDNGTTIKQGYLNSSPERTVRVRIKGDKGFLTIKSKAIGISRSEFEYEIPVDEAQQLLNLCEKRLLEKTRFLVTYEALVWEIDVFYGDNEGLVVAELELESETQHFNIPNWIGKEVTDDNRYFNSSLIKNPFLSWK